MTRYLEDVPVGDVGVLGTTTVTAEDVDSFARQYDPLPFHFVDEGDDGDRVTADVIASGFHTLAVVNAVVTTEFKRDLAVVAGLGLDDVTWPAPVRPGDELAVHLAIPEVRRSESDPSRGVYRLRVTAENQDGDRVISYVDSGLVHARDPNQA